MKPMLAKNWTSNIDPTGWYMSEKLDGIRAIWTGQEFVSRNEKPFVAPRWFIKDMPEHTMLDGELWMGRGRFNETSGQVRRRTNQDWSEIKYMVFDIPSEIRCFEEHKTILYQLMLPPHVYIVTQFLCTGRKHLQDFEAVVVGNKGEGVMLRDRRSKYEFKRSKYLLKVKKFKDDEAIVIGYINGEGKYKNVMGTLVCRYKGTNISIGTGFTDGDRKNPPPIGETITFKYFELSDYNIPRFPVYKGIRGYLNG